MPFKYVKGQIFGLSQESLLVSQVPKSQFTLVYLIPQELCINENRCYTMHPSTLFIYLSFVVASVLAELNLPGLPSKIYGVNLGSWYAFTNHDCFPILDQANYLIRLVLEPWMLPDGSSCESPRDEDRVALADFFLTVRMDPNGRSVMY